MKTENPKEVPALIGHKYAYRLVRGRWRCAGMVEDGNRIWWTKYWMNNQDTSDRLIADQVAFVPFMHEGSNFLGDVVVERCAVEISAPQPIEKWVGKPGQTLVDKQNDHDAAMVRALT